MATFDLNTLQSALETSGQPISGVDFSGKSLKLNTAKDAQPIVDSINSCPNLQYLTLTGNTLGVEAAQAIAAALAKHPELKVARFSDMFTGRMKTEIPLALSALGEGMIEAGAHLSVLDLSDNAFGPIGVEGLAKLLQSDVCKELEELRLNNNGLGITGARLLASALGASPRHLKTFIVGRNRLENDGAIALAKVLQGMGSLEEISMPQNGIYHPGVSALSEAFKHNPRLARLNLNDNTVGGRGASALADALPSLVNLKSINLGDCLLKSKGAEALAKAIKGNELKIECIDLSHNEIKRAACMLVTDALTALPDHQERLTRVVLAGNNLGDAESKKIMMEKLGGSAELSDGEGSDNDYEESGSDNSESELEESNITEDSGNEDTQHADTMLQDSEVSHDITFVEEVDSDVATFIREPTLENLNKLGPRAADVIDTHLQSIKDPISHTNAFVEASLLACGACGACGAGAGLLSRLVARAPPPGLQWARADALLRGLGLIKSENKNYKIRWSLPECYAALASVIDEPTFPNALRETLRFFITSKQANLPDEVREVIKKHPSLLS